MRHNMVVLLAVVLAGCSLVRVNGKPVAPSSASASTTPQAASQPASSAQPAAAGSSTSKDAMLKAAIEAKDLEGIRKNWTTGYDFNPRRPDVAAALFELNIETLANLLLESNCFAGCEDLQAIDRKFASKTGIKHFGVSLIQYTQPGSIQRGYAGTGTSTTCGGA